RIIGSTCGACLGATKISPDVTSESEDAVNTGGCRSGAERKCWVGGEACARLAPSRDSRVLAAIHIRPTLRLAVGHKVNLAGPELAVGRDLDLGRECVAGRSSEHPAPGGAEL